jgi:hypothetical protein
MYKIKIKNPIIIIPLTILDNIQYVDGSSGVQTTVLPNIPKMPEPRIPPLDIAEGAFD